MKRVNFLKFLDKKIVAQGGTPTVMDDLIKSILYKDKVSRSDLLEVKKEFALYMLDGELNPEQKEDLDEFLYKLEWKYTEEDEEQDVEKELRKKVQMFKD